MASRILTHIAKVSKQKLIQAIVIDVLGTRCSVKLSGNGAQLNGLKYYGPVPKRGDACQINYQTGTPYVQTQSAPVAEKAEPIIFPPDPAKQTLVRFRPTYTWSVETPVVGFIIGPRLKVAQIVLRIDGICFGGTSITFNIEIREHGGVPGTDIMSEDLTVDTDGEFQTVFDIIELPADYWIGLDISDVSGTPDQMAAVLSTME